MRGLGCGAALLLTVAVAGAGEDGPRLPRLDERAPVPAPAPDDTPARRLPRTAAVCHDPGAGRCWSAARAEECERVYRVVIDAPDDVAVALAQCREALADGAAPAR